MSDSTASYILLSWVRRGMCAAIPAVSSPTSGAPGRAGVNVSVQVCNREGEPVTEAGGGSPAAPFSQRAELYGPGDVTGLDPRQVIRTDPRHGTADFEPNYLASIEIDRPDLPWLLTPAGAHDEASGAADEAARLLPWLCLIVVPKHAAVLRTAAHQPLPVLNVSRKELPNLEEAWAWAHAQVVGDFKNAEELGQILADDPADSLSRLICPRRLEEQTSYYACVVPTFKAGCRAGLGETPDEAEGLAFSWDSPTSAPDEVVTLPVYYQWEFATGEDGNFEALVRRLKPRELPDVGFRDMDIGEALPEEGASGTVIGMGGALASVNAAPAEWSDEAREAFQSRLLEILDPPAGSPVERVTPPIYGSVHAGQQTVPVTPEEPPFWLRELNLDPRERVAAGLGTRVVQRDQEQLMASAWEQAGDVKGVNRALRQGQLARGVGELLLRKHFESLSLGSLLQITRPLHAFTGIRSALAKLPALSAAVSPAFRRVARRRGPTGRSVFSDTAQNSGSLVERIKDGRLKLRVTFPLTQPPDGAVEMNAVSRLPEFKLSKYRAFIRFNVKNAPGWNKLQEKWPAPPQTAVSPAPLARPAPIRSGGETSWADWEKMERNFKAAVTEHRRYLKKTGLLSYVAAAEKLTSLPRLRGDVLRKLEPRIRIRQRLQSRVKMSGRMWDRSDPLSPATHAPRFPFPMYEALAALSKEWLMPGVGNVPAETVGVLEPNRRFLEAYMVGLNHEMSRELLWREYPAELDATYFEFFWSAPQQDIGPIADWAEASHLGAHDPRSGKENFVVLLVRGELLRRYPTAVVYAAKAVWVEKKLAGGVTRYVRELCAEEEKYPMFRGQLEPDITYLAFNLTKEEARGSVSKDEDPGWFFVFQEQPVEPRFGLDAGGGELKGWSNLSWEHTEVIDNHLSVADTAASPDSDEGVAWGANSAQMAYITLRPAARIAVHADAMIKGPAADL